MSDLRSALDAMMRNREKQNETETDEVESEMTDNTPDMSENYDDIEDAEVVNAEDEYDNEEMSIQEPPSDDRYDESISDDSVQELEMVTMEQLEEENDVVADVDNNVGPFEQPDVIEQPQPVNLVETYGNFSPKQQFSLAFNQKMNIHTDGDVLSGRLTYNLILQGEGSDYEDDYIATSVNDMYAKNGIGIKSENGTNSYYIRCMSESLEENFNCLRKSAKSVLTDEDNSSVKTVIQAASQEVYQPQAVLASTFVEHSTLNEEGDIENRWFINMVCSNTGSYAVQFQGELRVGDKFTLSEQMENLFSAFDLMIESAQNTSDFENAHKLFGKSKLFKGYSMSIHHANCNHWIRGSFNWGAEERDIMSVL